MKVRAILEFDLEAEDGAPVAFVERFQQAAVDTEHAIRNRLMGAGFLDDDLVVDSWTLAVDVVEGTPDDPDPPP